MVPAWGKSEPLHQKQQLSGRQQFVSSSAISVQAPLIWINGSAWMKLTQSGGCISLNQLYLCVCVLGEERQTEREVYLEDGEYYKAAHLFPSAWAVCVYASVCVCQGWLATIIILEPMMVHKGHSGNGCVARGRVDNRVEGLLHPTPPTPAASQRSSLPWWMHCRINNNAGPYASPIMAIERSRGLWECAQGVLHLFTTGLMVQLQLSSVLPVVRDPPYWASMFGAHCPCKAPLFNELHHSWPWIYLAPVTASPRPPPLLLEKLQHKVFTLNADCFLTLKFHQLLTFSPFTLASCSCSDDPWKTGFEIGAAD